MDKPLHPCYSLSPPRNTGRDVPLVLDSPHSGRFYPDDFNHACPRSALEGAEDNDVDLLFESAPMHGASLLCATFARTYIDVNRAETDIDMNLLTERWPGPIMPSSRSHAGIGLLHRLIRPGLPIYNRSLSVAEIQHRLDHYYHPYHEALKLLLDDAHYRFGQVWHINCHSMPSSTALTAGPGNLHHLQPDFVLGDRDGTSCALDFTHTLRDMLRNMGYRVAINTPYKGVEIVRRYASPATGHHSIQIEINKALYWNEQNNERNKNFNVLQHDIDKLVSLCSNYVSAHLVNLAAD